MTHCQQRTADKQATDNARRSPSDMFWPLAGTECSMRLGRHHEHAGRTIIIL